MKDEAVLTVEPPDAPWLVAYRTDMAKWEAECTGDGFDWFFRPHVFWYMLGCYPGGENDNIKENTRSAPLEAQP